MLYLNQSTSIETSVYVDMTHRTEVFQSKVLKKLYPPAPRLEKEPGPPHIVDALAKKTYVKRKASQVETTTAETPNAANPGRRRLYTVLPPPADYKTESEKSVTLCQQKSINSAEDPAEESENHDTNEEQDQDKEEGEQIRKRRRRKRKPAIHPGRDGAAPVSESSTGQTQTPVDEGEEIISRNKKRKLKKKRHKEKLRSMGLMPRAAALEFTYQKDGEEEEEGIERRAADVADFLRTTMEIYMSDSSLCVDRLPHLSETVNGLLFSIASRNRPTSVSKQLCSLKVLVQQKETDKLEKALEELRTNSAMSADETTAVVSLFQYWITEVLPMQRDKETEFSTVHP